MLNRAIQCKYSCFKCGIKRRIVVVPARQEEDVVTWMETIMAPALSADHDRQSPHCKITKLDEVLIPIEGAEKVGGPDVGTKS